MGGHRVRGFAAYERREINSVSYGQENKNSVSPCLLFSIIQFCTFTKMPDAFTNLFCTSVSCHRFLPAPCQKNSTHNVHKTQCVR